MRNAGFTLLETMLVLFIVTSVLSVSQVVTIHHSNSMIDERTVAQFKYDMLLTQALAMQQKSKAQLKIENKRAYRITSDIRELERVLPEHTFFQHSSNLGRTLVFTAIGTTNAAGTIYYEGLEKNYHLIIQLGRGRVRLEDA